MKHATAFQDGLIAAKAGKKMLARIQFEQVTEISPDFADGWLWLAWTEDSFDASESLLQRAKELSPHDELISSFLDVVSRLKQYEVSEETEEVATDSGEVAEESDDTRGDEECALEEEVAEEIDVPRLNLDEPSGDGEESAEEQASEEEDAAAEEEAAEEAVAVEIETLDEDELELTAIDETDVEEDADDELEAEQASEELASELECEEAAIEQEDLEREQEVEATVNEQGECCAFIDGDIVACDQEVCDPDNCVAEKCKRRVEPEDVSEDSDVEVDLPVEAVAEDIESESGQQEDIVSEETEETAPEKVVSEDSESQEDRVMPVAAAATATAAIAGSSVEDASIEAEIVDEVEQLQAEVSEAVKPPAQPETKKRGKATILVVDDSPTVRKLITITLESAGYRVVTAQDGVEATKELINLTPAMILTDINMPRMDGYKLCKLVKKHEKTRLIPVVMLSGKDGVFDKLRGKMVGCNDYMSKPFEAADLLKFVEQYAGGTYVDA